MSSLQFAVGGDGGTSATLRRRWWSQVDAAIRTLSTSIQSIRINQCRDQEWKLPSPLSSAVNVMKLPFDWAVPLGGVTSAAAVGTGERLQNPSIIIKVGTAEIHNGSNVDVNAHWRRIERRVVTSLTRRVARPVANGQFQLQSQILTNPNKPFIEILERFKQLLSNSNWRLSKI